MNEQKNIFEFNHEELMLLKGLVWLELKERQEEEEYRLGSLKESLFGRLWRQVSSWWRTEVDWRTDPIGRNGKVLPRLRSLSKKLEG